MNEKDYESKKFDTVLDIKILDQRYLNEWSLPSYATPGSAGMDLRAAVTKPMVIRPGQVELIPTGLAIHMANPNMAATLLPRSGLGHKRGIILGNSVGLIDSDYQGQLFLSIWNRNNPVIVKTDELTEIDGNLTVSHKLLPNNEENNLLIIEPGMILAQIVFVPIVRIDGFRIVDEFETSVRAEGGFGHTTKT